MSRLLYLLPGLVPPSEDPALDGFTYLSQVAEGDILLPIWCGRADKLGPYWQASFPEFRRGAFCYHMHLGYKWPKLCRPWAKFLFYVRTGLCLHRRKRFDAVITYGTNSAGVAAVLLKWLTGARLVVELPGVPENIYRYDRPRPGFRSSLRRFVANRLLHFTGRRADCFSLLYPGQLQHYPALRTKKSVVLHAFVPTKSPVLPAAGESYVLSVGYPWYTKGMDILMRAYREIAPEFPDWKLKLVGFLPDPGALEALRGDCRQIEILGARHYAETLRIIAGCSVFVLASRTEAMGRVLLEAMAAGRPLLASAVGGIPHYVTDGGNGLLFPSGDVDALANRLRVLMSDEGLRERLGRNGRARVAAELDERAYVRGFAAMLHSLGLGDGESAAVLAAKTAPPRSARTGLPQGRL